MQEELAGGTFHRRQLARRRKIDVKKKNSRFLASNELTPEFAVITTAETRGEM